MNYLLVYRLRKMFLHLAIFFIPLSGLGSFIPYFSYSLIFILLYMFLFSSRMQRKSKNFQNKYAIGSLIILNLIIVFSSFANFVPNSFYSFSYIRQFILNLFIFYILSYAMIDGTIVMKSILKYYILGVVVLLILNFLGIGRSVDEKGRLILLGVNPNKIAIFASVAVLFCINIIQYYRHSFEKKVLIYLIILALIYLMISTGSRGGIIGLSLALITYFYYKEKSFKKRLKSIITGFLLVIILALLALSNDVLYNRFFPTDESAITDDRYFIWFAVQDIISNNLLFGIGVFKYEIEITRIMGNFMAVHNEYLTIITFAGLVGLLFFIFFLLEVLKSALRSANKNRNPLFISLFVLLLFTLFKAGGILFSILTWFLFAFILYSNKILINNKLLFK